MPLSPPSSGAVVGASTLAVSPAFSTSVDAIPTLAMSPALSSSVEGVPGQSLSPPFSTSVEALDPPSYLPVRVDDDAVHLKEFDEGSEFVAVAYVGRSSPGNARLWQDQQITSLQVGGGASYAGSTIGRSGQTTRLAGLLVTDDALTPAAGKPLLLGSELELTLSGRGQATPLNEASQLNLNTPFYSSSALSLLGAINEALSKSARFTQTTLTNANAGSLTAGTVVRISAAGSVDLASAAADTAASEAIGSAVGTIPTALPGKIALEGEIPVKFAAGEGAGPHGKKPVYLSTTAGFGTLVAPSASGSVILLLGYVVDAAGYSDGSGGTMLISTVRAQRRVNP